MEEQAEARTLKNGSPSASIKIFEAFFMVSVLERRPIAQTAMHLTAGSSDYFLLLVGPDFRRFLISASRQG